MKKVLLLLLGLVSLYAFTETSTTISPAVGIDICHYDAGTNSWSIINIDESEWAIHAAHGDVRVDDQDGDGYVLYNECNYGQQGDCNDDNPDVYPGATDICDNGIDENCNGVVDDDCPTSCVTGELEVTLPDGSTLYVYPTDNDVNIQWGEFGNDIDGLDNITSQAVANADFNGESNTAAIIDDLGNWNGGDYAANLCANLSAQTGCDWYLPAAGELNAMYQQLGPTNNGFNGSGDMPNGVYWSSTEFNDDGAWKPDFFDGNQFFDLKDFSNRCRCVRR